MSFLDVSSNESNTMEFLLSVLDKALQKSFNTNQNLRQGLPIGFFRQVRS